MREGFRLFKDCNSCVVPCAIESLYMGKCWWWPFMKNKIVYLNFFLASGEFHSLLISFANSLEPDQDRQNVGPDLDTNHLTLF